MHTLVTQMRVRRLLRLHAAEVDRMRHGTMPRRVRSAAVRKLLDASASVRAGWAAEMAAVEPGATPDGSPRHVEPATQRPWRLSGRRRSTWSHSVCRADQTAPRLLSGPR